MNINTFKWWMYPLAVLLTIAVIGLSPLVIVWMVCYLIFVVFPVNMFCSICDVPVPWWARGY